MIIKKNIFLIIQRKHILRYSKEQSHWYSKEQSHLDGSFEHPKQVLKMMDKFVCLFVFVALRPMSTAMVIAGRSVHLTTLFPGQA